MADYTIVESYELPSKGLIYDYEIDPIISLRSMTTAEEMMRLAPTKFSYRNMCNVLDACIVSDTDISSYDMCIGDYQFLLHRLRLVTYGNEYNLTTVCPVCGHQNLIKLNLDELPVFEYTDEFESYREFDLPKSGKHIRLNITTPRLLDKINERTEEVKRKARELEYDPSLIYMLVELIESIDGVSENPAKVEKWIRELPMSDTNLILAYAEKLNNMIGVDVNLELDCDLCLSPFSTTFKMNNEFFRPVVDLRR